MINDEIKIRQLLKKFMDGTTTLDEEQEIAQWFRIHPKVSDDLEDYRTMFAWFDDGMPLDSNNEIVFGDNQQAPPQGKDRKRNNRRWLYLCIAVAASAALLVGLFLTRTNDQGTATPQLAIGTIQKDTTRTPASETTVGNETQSDTINTHINNNAKMKEGKRRRGRLRFEPVLPPPLYAQADTNSVTPSMSDEPTLAKAEGSYEGKLIDEATANKIINDMIASMERDEQLQLKLIDLLNKVQSQEIMATLDDDNIY